MESTIFSTVQRKKRDPQGDDAVMDNLSDDLLVCILSRMSLKEAARTCVLARRWKYLWRFATLGLDSESLVTAIGDVMEAGKFESLLNTLLEVQIEGIVISFDGMQEHYEMTERLSHSVAVWMYAALLEDGYGFSNVQMFSRLKTLRLVHVEIEDEAINHFLASAPVLEEFCVSFSKVTQNLQVVDPPSLRSLEIIRCCSIRSVEISAANLVSLTYGGGKNSLLLKKVPKLCKLSISNEFAAYCVLEPKQDSIYISAQLVELILDLQSSPHLHLFTSLKRLKVAAFSGPGRNSHFLTVLLEAASKRIVEFSLEIDHKILKVKIDHKSLKVVEMDGFVGSQDKAR